MSNAYVPRLSKVYVAYMSVHDEDSGAPIHGTETKFYLTQELIDKVRAANKYYAGETDEYVAYCHAGWGTNYSCDKVEVTEDYV